MKVNEGVYIDPLGLILIFIVNNIYINISVGRIY